ncbi:MAG: IPTL-CTERM sorting domain-containing protein, partial [Thermodesulfobacteriota bacterium]
DEVLRYNGTTGSFLGVFVTDGSGGLNNPSDLVFRPLSRNVPTLSEWSLIALALVLGIVGFVILRRRLSVS